jgi:hypothetical protein
MLTLAAGYNVANPLLLQRNLRLVSKPVALCN